MTKVILEVIRSAEDRLRTAKFGLEDMARPERSESGFHNAIVFGRMVTFALQNLRSITADFDDWYAVKQEEMKLDDQLKMFVDLRNSVEKQAGQLLSRKTVIRNFSSSDMGRFQPRPPGAVELVLGDRNGGSGWVVEGPNGEKEMYYVDLPPDVGETQSFIKHPSAASTVTAQEHVAAYLQKLENLIREAKSRFL